MSMDPAAADSRPRERKSEKTRRRILDAAAEVLNRDGFAGARLSDIAARAEVRVPGLYYYFESREAILEEVVLIGTRLTMAHVEAKLAQLPVRASPLDRICTAFGAHLEMVLKESAYTAAAMRTMGQLPGDIRDRQLHQQRIYGELWRGLFAAGTASGDIDPELDARAARMFLIGAVNWAPEWFDPERGSIEQAVAAIELLVRKALSRASGGVTAAPGRGDLAPLFVPPVR
ncbi:transcriptional regulator, TetR family [Nocardia nova SH22a]|uniref:Transcriptional regulator, TetR family n=2 Tax=Nocardia nova TaxID=37330 RepID=W5TE28_9NOCA|nr:transcriptional regulator, TetR family [Nocardia nova SH22a]